MKATNVRPSDAYFVARRVTVLRFALINAESGISFTAISYRKVTHVAAGGQNASRCLVK